MRRTIALWFVTSSLACGCAAGLAAPAALASGSGGVTISNPATSPTPSISSQPSFNLNSAQNAVSPPVTTVPASSTSTATSSTGLSSLDGVIIAVVAGVLLVGIAFLVRSDARRHLAQVAHGGHDDPFAGQRAHAGSKAARKPRKLKPAERKRRKRGRAR